LLESSGASGLTLWEAGQAGYIEGVSKNIRFAWKAATSVSSRSAAAFRLEAHQRIRECLGDLDSYDQP
jgi:hypothetical protein